MRDFGLIFSSVAIALLAASEADAANISFSKEAPVLGPADIANLSGARTENDNVNYGDHDAIYVAYDRPIQGQTFTTGTNSTGYYVRSITLREVKCETYCLVPNLKYTIRITRPIEGKLEVLATETGEAAAAADRNFPTIGGGGDTGTGSGNFITFTLEKPVKLAPNTTHGFDVSGGTAPHYWQMDGTASNAYEGGTAYSILKDDKFKPRNGDHVFVVKLATSRAGNTAQTPSSQELK